MPDEKGRDMRLRIAACRPMYHGRNTHGDEYSIYEVEALKPDGQLINEKLRSFQSLPVGQDIEVTVVPFHSERHGKSYTLYPKGKTGGGTQAVNELREELEHFREGCRKLAGRVAGLEKTVDRLLRERGEAPKTPESEELDAKFGTEAPW